MLSETHKTNETLSQLLHGIYLVMEASPRTLDYVLSFGERNSAHIIAAYFEKIGIDSQFADARHLIKTNKRFGAAQVDSMPHGLMGPAIIEWGFNGPQAGSCSLPL